MYSTKFSSSLYAVYLLISLSIVYKKKIFISVKIGNAYVQLAVYLKEMSLPHFGYKVKQLHYVAKLDGI